MSPWTRSTPKRSANARPLSSELPRQAASREPGLLTMAGATKSAAAQPGPTIPQRTGDCPLLTAMPPCRYHGPLGLFHRHGGHTVGAIEEVGVVGRPAGHEQEVLFRAFQGRDGGLRVVLQ